MPVPNSLRRGHKIQFLGRTTDLTEVPLGNPSLTTPVSPLPLPLPTVGFRVRRDFVLVPDGLRLSGAVVWDSLGTPVYVICRRQPPLDETHVQSPCAG